jgi:hypothetical protein
VATEPAVERLPTRVARGVADRLSALLGADLLGVYLIGSGALGGFAPESSDVDVAAVATHHPSPEATEAIVDAVSAEAMAWPVRGVEFVLYPAAGAAAASDLAILRAHGVPILGPAAPEVVGPVPRDRLLDALLASLTWHIENEAASISTVLNACRAWRFVTEGVWSNKEEAGRWAQPIADDAALVAAALAGRRDESGRRLDPARVREFVRGVETRVSRARDHSIGTTV